MLLELSISMVVVTTMRFPCEVLSVVPESREDKETRPDWLHTDASDAFYKIYQNKASGPLISVLK